MTDRSDGLLREVEAELRRERLTKLWDRYGVLAVAGAAALVIGVGWYQYSTASARSAAEVAGAQFQSAIEALEDKKTELATEQLGKLAREASTGYATLAELHTASAHMTAGKPADAVAALDAVSSNSGADPLLRDFARLQAAAIRAGEADWSEIETRLGPLVKDASPWALAAREIWGAAAIKAGKIDEARKTFEQILADPNLPPEMGERVRTLMASVVAMELAGAATPAASAPPAGQPKSDAPQPPATQP